MVTIGSSGGGCNAMVEGGDGSTKLCFRIKCWRRCSLDRDLKAAQRRNNAGEKIMRRMMTIKIRRLKQDNPISENSNQRLN